MRRDSTELRRQPSSDLRRDDVVRRRRRVRPVDDSLVCRRDPLRRPPAVGWHPRRRDPSRQGCLRRRVAPQH